MQRRSFISIFLSSLLAPLVLSYRKLNSKSQSNNKLDSGPFLNSGLNSEPNTQQTQSLDETLNFHLPENPEDGQIIYFTYKDINAKSPNETPKIIAAKNNLIEMTDQIMNIDTNAEFNLIYISEHQSWFVQQSFQSNQLA